MTASGPRRSAAAFAVGDSFAQVVWNHELADTERNISAFLTSSSYAPGYSMPGVELGKDWGTATVGTSMSYPTFGKRKSASNTGMEQRQFDRRRTSVVGRILIGTHKSVRCTIVEMSHGGALLMVASGQAIPASFKLEDASGRRRSVRVIRRDASLVGVKFN
jgi:hypothetical protein